MGPSENFMNQPVIIIGGGISGLTVAYRLEQAQVPYLLLEAGTQLGGNIRTVERAGFLYDVGPDSFLRAKKPGEELCRELGLSEELIVPQDHGRSVWVAHDGRLFPMPEGLTLGVPKRPWPLLNTPLLSPMGKCRALLEPWVPARQSPEEESIAQFLSRRLGTEMAERLAAPLLSGVFAGDAQALSMDAAFGQMVLLEKKYGSLFSGMNGGKSPFSVLFEAVKDAPSPFVSLARGLGSLVDALVATLPEQKLQLQTRVQSIVREGEGYCVTSDRGRLSARAVVVAGPPWMAAELVSGLSRALSDTLAEIRGFQTATVYFALHEEQMDHHASGSGFIVPPGEGEILAATFVSSKWQGRAPAGRALLRAFVGGARVDISSLSSAQLEQVAHRELTRFLGPLGPVEFSAVYRYEKGTPQPELGHKRRLAHVQSCLAKLPGVSLIGSGYGAVGIPDCIAQANEVAARQSAG